MSSPVLSDHQWPTEPEAHVWGLWAPYSANAHYRMCVHPNCSASEIRKVGS